MKSFPYQISNLEEYHQAYQKSIKQPAQFWEEIAQNFTWKKKWDSVLEWNFKDPKIEWFKGAQLNITENCLDRHLKNFGDQAAIIWEPNNPDEPSRELTYNDLYKKVCQFSHVLKNNGVKKGDTVCIYMGMIPELAIAVLSCARIGAVHSVVFGGFSAQSISDRLHDAKSEFVITCDGAFRGQKNIPLKSVIDEALISCPFVKRVIVYSRTQIPLNMIEGRDTWWEEEIKKIETKNCNIFEAEVMEAEDPLFILYTSGSTGKPKGVVHSTAGYMIYTNYTFINTFQYQTNDIFFCTADIGWITGHSYLLYGPLSAGATTVLFEGIPTWPNASRLWDIIDKYKINTLYTAPTAIRSLMSYGLGPLKGKGLSSLKVLGTVGEPINEEAWHWYNTNIGKNKCPIVDTWWQTETGGILISNLAGITPAIPSFATLPMPGIIPCLIDENGKEIEENNVNGNLCIKQAWPSIIRTTFGDHERCRKTYFSTYENKYYTGDGAYRDANGNYRITGRVDDVLNVSGHRIGTAEIENAINQHNGVIESAVVGYPHDIKGQGIYAYIIYNKNIDDVIALNNNITQTVSNIIGPFAKLDKIQFVNGLPKTRSGKIMRRILRKIAENDLNNLGDTTTLLDPNVVNEIKNGRI
jgi:acetyl-CoA synthetase